MTDDKLVQMLGSVIGGGAAAGALLLILYRVTSRIVERLIAAIDRIGVQVTDVKEAVIRIEAKQDAERQLAADRADDPPPRNRTNPHGYRPPRPGGHHDD